jgi:hypothetical protein
VFEEDSDTLVLAVARACFMLVLLGSNFKPASYASTADS